MKTLLEKLVLLIVIALILSLFFHRLDYFPFYVFDEVYFAEAAIQMFKGLDDQIYQHPPFGKTIISLPFYIVGVSPFSWRVASVVFGLGGLVCTYILGKILGLTRIQSLIAVLMLIASRGWLTYSRVATLDIFVSVFVLLAGMMLIVYLKKYEFDRNYDLYKPSWVFIACPVFIGLGGAVKWSAFFLFLLIIGLYLYYFTGSLRKRLVDFIFICLISLYVYFICSTVAYGNFYQVLVNIGEQFAFHSSGMLPKNVQLADPGSSLLPGGFEALVRYLFLDQVVTLKKIGYLPYSYSNNPVLAYSFVVFGLLLVFNCGKYIVESVKKRQATIAPFVRDKRILFLYMIAFVLIMPWGVIPRVQYIYYFIPAFPFLSVGICIFLFKYCSQRIQLIYLLTYFGFFFIQIRQLIPF